MTDPKFPAEKSAPVLDVPAAARGASHPYSHDATLQARIWEQIHAAPEIDTADLRVVVRNRSATLFGTVAEEGQRAQLARIAMGVSGVLEVTNRLKVAASTH